jgi:hypothetical protein
MTSIKPKKPFTKNSKTLIARNKYSSFISGMLPPFPSIGFYVVGID